jgi:molecular chaperone GrpE
MDKSNPKDTDVNSESNHEAEEEIDPIASDPQETDPQISSEESSQDIEQITNTLQRVQADFVNFKRRSGEDRQEQLKFANGQLILKILPIVDEFHMALNQTDLDNILGSWREGFDLIYRKLEQTLASAGVTRIKPCGMSFDPFEHEALSQLETTEHKDGTIMEVIRDGYKLHDRMLRPAQVIVAKEASNENTNLGKSNLPDEEKENL